jgi:thiamine biosynthesis protein ThiS
MECQPKVSEGTIAIRVNGEHSAVPQGATVLDLLARLQLDPERVAIELDRRIVKRPEWERRVLEMGAELEIVQFVGGG